MKNAVNENSISNKMMSWKTMVEMCAARELLI